MLSDALGKQERVGYFRNQRWTLGQGLFRGRGKKKKGTKSIKGTGRAP